MIESIATALTSVKAAGDIIKGINALNINVEVKTKTSELLAVIIDLQTAMLELQSKLAEMQLENQTLKQKICELNNQTNSSDKLKFKNHVCWRDGDSTPFCPRCYEVDEKEVHLSGPQGDYNCRDYYCKECENSFEI